MELVKKGAHLKSNCSADTCKYNFMIFYGYMPLCHVHLPLIVGSNPNFRCFIEKPRKWTDSSHDEAWKLESCAVGTTACDVPMRPAMIQCQWDFRRSSRMLWPEDTGMWNETWILISFVMQFTEAVSTPCHLQRWVLITICLWKQH